MAENEALNKLVNLFGGLKAHSKLALNQAFQAREVAGVGATMIVQIPSDPRKPAEVYYSTVPSKIVGEPWRSYQGNF